MSNVCGSLQHIEYLPQRSMKYHFTVLSLVFFLIMQKSGRKVLKLGIKIKSVSSYNLMFYTIEINIRYFE